MLAVTQRFWADVAGDSPRSRQLASQLSEAKRRLFGLANMHEGTTAVITGMRGENIISDV